LRQGATESHSRSRLLLFGEGEMAKARKRTARKGGAGAKVTAVAKKPEDIQNVRNKITNAIVDESVEMAQRVVQSVKEGGNATTLKYLWEVAGLFPADPATASDADREPLAHTLMQRLGFSMDALLAGETEEQGDVESETLPKAEVGQE
jgi:hypothetical protein